MVITTIFGHTNLRNLPKMLLLVDPAQQKMFTHLFLTVERQADVDIFAIRGA